MLSKLMHCLQNTLIFMYTPAPGTIRDITVQRIIAEAIGGDCMSFAYGVQNLLVEDIQVRDFLRQGVDLAGNNITFNHTVRRVTELPWRRAPGDGYPGGSTLHIEEAGTLKMPGLRDVEIYGCVANHSVLASGVHNLTIRDNLIIGRMEANFNTHFTVERNTIVASVNGSMMMMLAPQGVTITDNTLLHADDGLAESGIYIWGHDENYPSATDIAITGNTFTGPFTQQAKAIQLFGVDGVVVSGNRFQQTPNGPGASNNTCECCRIPSKIATMCRNVSIASLKTDDGDDVTETGASRKTVMAWLTGCGANWTDCADFILRGPAKGAVNAVSAGGLIELNSTDWTLHAADSETIANWKRVWGSGIRTFPVIGAGGNITSLRPLFAKANITAFATSAAAVVAELGFAGLNLDFEPATFVHEPAMDGPNPSVVDGLGFAALVDATAKALHKVGKTLSVDTQTVVGACWSDPGPANHTWDLRPCPWIRRFFNHDALAASAVDRTITMDTYTTNSTAWPYVIYYMQKYYNIEDIGWGLYTTSSGWGHTLPHGQTAHEIISDFDI